MSIDRAIERIIEERVNDEDNNFDFRMGIAWAEKILREELSGKYFVRVDGERDEDEDFDCDNCLYCGVIKMCHEKGCPAFTIGGE